MQVFFVSLRTALIFGPGEVLDVRASSDEQMYLRAEWPHPYAFDEWEGYAVVAPERNEVWGMCHPRIELGELVTEFAFTPQVIPEQERKLFDPSTANPPEDVAEQNPDHEPPKEHPDENEPAAQPVVARKRVPKPSARPKAKPDDEDWGKALNISQDG